MANMCWNQIEVSGAEPHLREYAERLLNAPSGERGDSWASVVYEIADELGIKHVSKLNRIPVGSSFELSDDADGRFALSITFEARLDYDERFMECFKKVFNRGIVSFYAEDFSNEWAVRYTWRDGRRTEHDEITDHIYVSDLDAYALRWYRSGWELDGERTTWENISAQLAQGDEDARLAAASHEDTPATVLITLIEDEDEDVRTEALNNPNLSRSAVEDAVRGRFEFAPDHDLTDLPLAMLVTYLQQPRD